MIRALTSFRPFYEINLLAIIWPLFWTLVFLGQEGVNLKNPHQRGKSSSCGKQLQSECSNYRSNDCILGKKKLKQLHPAGLWLWSALLQPRHISAADIGVTISRQQIVVDPSPPSPKQERRQWSTSQRTKRFSRAKGDPTTCSPPHHNKEHIWCWQTLVK